jgi:RNA polymerase sigma-70 factor (ECF subfamily)
MKSSENLGPTEDELIPTRETLLSRLKNWTDQESWNRFFNTYWRLIYVTAVKAGLSKEEAQDVVQETVISVCKSMPEFKYDPKRGSFKGWLLQLTRWRVRDQVRKRLPETIIKEDEAGAPAWPAMVEDLPGADVLRLETVWDEEWDKALIHAAIERVKRKVSLKQFQIFDLHVLQKLPVAEVRKILNVSSGRIYLAKHRISAVLKKEMERLEKHLL